VQVATSSKSTNYTTIPAVSSWKLTDDSDVKAATKTSTTTTTSATAATITATPTTLTAAAAPGYVYYCANETVHGVEFPSVPDLTALGFPAGSVPLVADVSSCFCSAPIDVTKFLLIYAGAQKNVGPAGVTVVIVREDALSLVSDLCPSALNYKIASDNNSMYNTPPCFSIYLMGLTFDWILEQGGVSAMEQRNRDKSRLLYDFIDQSKLYYAPVAREVRSRMNVIFYIGSRVTPGNAGLQKEFAAEAEKQDIVNVEGHRSVGGMRVSLYNAISVADVQRLIEFMRHFESTHPSVTTTHTASAVP